MPQMAPYNWFILFYLFNAIMIFLISFNHFILYYKNFSYNLTLKNKFNWMW